MKLTLIFFITISIAPVVCFGQSERAREGCVDPKIIGAVLAKMTQANQQTTSVDQIRSLRPAELTDVENTAENRTLRSLDRIIRGSWECCTDFLFKVAPDSGRSREDLYGIIVNYSTPRREALTDMAKMFAESVGLDTSDLRTVGRQSPQHYQWQSKQNGETILYVLECRFNHEANGPWKMGLNFTRYVVEPLK
jgi:hypothetical protein